MANTEGMSIKYIVFKWEDVDTYLTDKEFEQLDSLCAKINVGRINEGKKLNTYLVVNSDEAYSDQVIDTMKANGHWG